MMQSQRPERLLDRSNFATYPSYLADTDTLWDRLLQPSILVPLGILLLTVLYQSLHASAPFVHVRHPGVFLWDLAVIVVPARLLYALDHWLHPPLFPVPSSMLSAQPSTYAAKSDLLRRILNMESPKDIINAVAHAGKSLSSLSNIKSKHMTDQPPGLGNYDNSCFQNSILQSLSSLKPFPAYLTSALEDAEAVSDSWDSSSVATLRDLLSKLTDSQNNGATLWTPRKLKSLDTWQQQDAQEYYSKILDEIDKEVTKVAMTQCRSPGLEVTNMRDDTVESQHSDDSGYQSLSTLGKPVSEVRTTKNPLEGLIAQRVACVQCGHSEGLSMIPFNCITLSLGVGQGVHDLYERLDSYTTLESIQGVECAKCTLLKIQRLWNIVLDRNRADGQTEEDLREPLARLRAVEEALEDDDFEEATLHDKCKISKQHRVSSTKTKQMVIGRPPSSLAIHINRSVFDENTGQMFKNLAAVRFPSTLDLGPWCLGSAGPHGAAQDSVEQWSSDPKSSMVSGDLRPSTISGPIYELRAVITHQGRHENGHYVCYRKHPRQPATAGNSSNEKDTSQTDDPDMHDEESSDLEDAESTDKDSKWWRLSDETVWEVEEEAVLAQGGVFMLFYDCVDPNPVLVSEGLDQNPTSSNNDKLAGVPEAHEADSRTNTEDQIQNIESGSGVLEGPEVMAPPTEHPPRLKQTMALSTEQLPVDHATSLLYPLLNQDEHVDSMIPQHWPNS